MIVDTSALMAILLQEPEGKDFTRQLYDAPSPRMSAATLVEAQIVAQGRNIAHLLDALIERLGIAIVPVDEEQARIAAEGFKKFGKGRHAAGLNYGDLFAYALAVQMQEPCCSREAISRPLASWLPPDQPLPPFSL
jgi:ribonuclease VapC